MEETKLRISRPRHRPGRPGRMFAMAAIMCVASMVLASCLMPGEHDPTGNEPIGSLDLIEAVGSSVRVAGWAIDPNTKSPVNVTVAYLGLNVKVTANRPRPDVAAAFPGFGAAHGFEFTTPSLGSGIGQVCVWIENVGPGSQGRLLGCHDIALRSDNADGAFDVAQASSLRSVRVGGWGLDPKTPNSVNVSWSLNGRGWNNHLANLPRADVNRATGVAGNHGFAFDITVLPGHNKICMRVPANGRGSAKDLGCRTVKNESVTKIGPGLDLLNVKRVQPPAGHALAEMSRDAGVSTRLSDGSVMWFFGDTSGFRPDGSLTYFINNTAAWASGASPTVTRDAVAPGPSPYLSMQPKEAFISSCAPGWKPVLWPTSAVTVAESSSADRVLVYFVNMCLGGEWKFDPKGIGIAEFNYDRTSPPIEQRVTGRIITQTVFSGNQGYGQAAVYDGQFVHAYQCGAPEADGQIHWPNDPAWGPCTVARVSPADAGNLSKYRYWAGGDHWSPNPASAAALDVPAQPTAPTGDKQMPVSGFTIVKDPHHGYVMVYTPWPGLSEQIMIRKADSPVGPWSPPQVYRVPGCDDSAGGEGRFCYAATAQPLLSTPRSIGIGYFDDLISLTPTRGGYLAGTLPRRW